MTSPTTQDSTITALAPQRDAFDPAWSQATLVSILEQERPAPRRARAPRRALAGLAAAFLTLGTATAVAVGGPGDVVERVLTEFGEQPNTSGNGMGALDDPLLVAQFETGGEVFAFWVATSSSGTVCSAMADGWDGQGTPREEQLSYGCGGQVYVGPGRPPQDLTRPDQLGGFFKDGEPMVYGVSPYPRAAEVHVQADGVDVTLPVRSDSLGYGAALPTAGEVDAVTLTFVDADGLVLGRKRSVAPVG